MQTHSQLAFRFAYAMLKWWNRTSRIDTPLRTSIRTFRVPTLMMGIG